MRWNMILLTAAGVMVTALAVAYGAYLWTTLSVERPKYQALLQDGAFEVRDYPEMVVAEIITSGDRWEGVRQGFRPLAAYIFAKERSGDKIAMTAPVTQSAGLDDQQWRIRFIMPSKHDLNALPAPANAAIKLTEVAPGRRAAIRFSGVATDELLAAKEEQLRQWMEKRNLQALGGATFAYYNDPFTPGFLRRNEVLFDIKPAP